MEVKSIRQLKNLAGKKVFLRADFNIPLKDGKIQDDYKIAAALPTIRYLFRYKCKVIIATHLGEPKSNQKSKISAQGGSASGGKNQKYYSIKPIARRLSALLGKKVRFVNDGVGEKVKKEINKMKEGDVLLLENLRFYKGEGNNDKKFAKSLAKLAQIYVNDAFAVCHRNHASVGAIKKYLPSYAGLLLEKEIINLGKVIRPKKPLVVIIGGAKISTKLPLIKKILKKARYILIGGASANVFLAALGYRIGKSLAPKEEIRLLKKEKLFFKKSDSKKILLPIDVVASDRMEGSGKVRVRKIDEVKKDEIILDIGPQTIKLFSRIIKEAKTIIWNGPMGKFEAEHFRHGSLAMARVIASCSSGRAFGVAGGGETIGALKMTHMMDYIDWVSTGGGAMLALLGREKMPGLEGIAR